MALLSVVLAVWFLIGSANGAVEESVGDGGDGAGMAAEELLALFEVVGDLLEDPSWAQYHPHPCTDTPWPGIQCELIQGQRQQPDPLLHVTKLHVGPDVVSPPCKPSPKLSPSLLNLPHLKTLSLFNCFLTPQPVDHLPPSLFTNASALEQLVLKSNPGLSGEIPSSIGELRSLRVLSLSQNAINGRIPKELGGLVKLEQLDLSYNHLSGNIPVEIGALTRLTIIDFCSNKLEGAVPSSIGQLQSLQKLDFSSNNLSGEIPPELGKLQRLVLLDLSYNSLAGPIPETLSGMKELQYFLLENNPIGTGIPYFIEALKKLAVLGFSNCGLSGPIPKFFSSLSSLTALSLDRNKLNGSVPSSLGALPMLGQLNLSQNKLSGEIVFSEGFVARLGRRLDVRDNKSLCTNQRGYHNLSLCLGAPPCLDSSSKSNNRSWSTGPDDGNPSLSESESESESSSNGSLDLFPWFWDGLGIFVILMQYY